MTGELTQTESGTVKEGWDKEVQLFTLIVTESRSVVTLPKKISSKAKSFPANAVFRLTIELIAVVLLPEFQLVANCFHKQDVLLAVKVFPISIPLIEN